MSFTYVPYIAVLIVYTVNIAVTLDCAVLCVCVCV